MTDHEHLTQEECRTILLFIDGISSWPDLSVITAKLRRMADQEAPSPIAIDDAVQAIELALFGKIGNTFEATALARLRDAVSRLLRQDEQPDILAEIAVDQKWNDHLDAVQPAIAALDQRQARSAAQAHDIAVAGHVAKPDILAVIERVRASLSYLSGDEWQVVNHTLDTLRQALSRPPKETP